MHHDHLNIWLEKIRNPEKRNWIIMVPNSLAETVVVCGLSRAFIDKHGYGITLVIPQSHSFIVNCYPDTFDRVIHMSLEDMRAFTTNGFIPNNFFQIDFPINTWPLHNGDGRAYALYELWISTVGRAGLNFLNLYRYILHLDWNSTFQFLKIPELVHVESDKLIKKFGIKKNKSVIFFIGNNSNSASPAYLWERIAEFYRRKGIDVIINKFGAMFIPEGLSISFAKIIDIPLELTVPICEHAGNVVSGTNGFIFMALAANIKAKLDILLPNSVCCDYGNLLFKEINYMAGCTQLCAPEITCNAHHLKEWIIPLNNDKTELDDIANDIVNDLTNKYTISS